MNTLISLKSRIMSEALYDLLRREDDGSSYFLSEQGNAAFDCRPDVIVVDHESLNHDLAIRWPEAKLILLDTGLQQDEVITLFLSYKLVGVISPAAETSFMKKALKVVHEGQIWIDSDSLKALLYKAGTISKSGRIDTVSNREQQILDQLALGKKNKEIAAQLFMSEQTVKAHLSRIFKKFNVSSRTQLLSHLNQTR
jgi:DNA-binding NarL/FixJ family response regulator